MIVLLMVGVGCATAAALAPTSAPEPSPAIFPALTDIPSCIGLKRLIQRIAFEWPGQDILDSVEAQNWNYYSCAQSPADVSALYKDKMKDTPYGWLEMGWIEREEGTLGIYFHTGHQRWLYTWFLADKANEKAARLVLMWREADWPVTLPCCEPQN